MGAATVLKKKSFFFFTGGLGGIMRRNLTSTSYFFGTYMRRDAVRDGATILWHVRCYDGAAMWLRCCCNLLPGILDRCGTLPARVPSPEIPPCHVLSAQCFFYEQPPFSYPGTRKAGDGSSWGRVRSARRLYLHSTPCSTTEHQPQQQHRCVCGALVWCLLPKVEFSTNFTESSWLGHLTFFSTSKQSAAALLRLVRSASVYLHYILASTAISHSACCARHSAHRRRGFIRSCRPLLASGIISPWSVHSSVFFEMSQAYTYDSWSYSVVSPACYCCPQHEARVTQR